MASVLDMYGHTSAIVLAFDMSMPRIRGELTMHQAPCITAGANGLNSLFEFTVCRNCAVEFEFDFQRQNSISTAEGASREQKGEAHEVGARLRSRQRALEIAALKHVRVRPCPQSRVTPDNVDARAQE